VAGTLQKSTACRLNPDPRVSADTKQARVNFMSQALKAALFSAFVFPGSGHFFLKKHVRGALLVGVTILSFWALLSTALEKAQEISRKIQSGEIPLDITRITDEVSKLVTGGDVQQANIATFVLLICWLVGTVDAYRVGRIQDKADGARDKQPG